MAWNKGPDERLPYGVDFTTWLANEEDTAASATWTVSAGITHDTESLVGSVAFLWLSGGTLGEDYFATCVLTTTGGRMKEHTQRIQIRQQ